MIQRNFIQTAFQAIEPNKTPDDIETEKSDIEDNSRQLEQEVEEEEERLAEAEELSQSLDDVNSKIEEITTSSRQVRQAPTTCDEVADRVVSIENAETIKEKLQLSKLILQTTLQKCTNSEQLNNVGIHHNKRFLQFMRTVMDGDGLYLNL